MDFNPAHEHTEEIYNSMATFYDDTAKRVIQLGGKPHLTLSDLVKSSKIEEEMRDSFYSKEVVENIVKDFNYLLNSFKALSEAADEASDSTTVAFSDDHIASLEKELWILGAMLK